MSKSVTNPIQIQTTTCPGIQESSIIPILLSSLSTTELCLMFLIERDRAGQNITYRSRNCKFVIDEKYCSECQDLLDNLRHFHHLHLKKSCKEFQKENDAPAQAVKQNETKLRNLGNVTLTIKTIDDEKMNEQEFGDNSEEEALFNICDECGEVFDDKDLLENHTLMQHKQNTQEVTNAKEVIIKIEDSNSSSQAIIEEETIFNICDECGEVFDDKNLLEKHFLLKHNHSQGTPEISDVIKEKEKKKCKYCEKVFDNPKQRSRHVRIYHLDILEVRKEEIKRRKECESQRKIVCKHCEKDFDSKTLLSGHVDMFHNDLIRDAKGNMIKKNIRCPFCPDLEVWRNSIYKHRLNQHPYNHASGATFKLFQLVVLIFQQETLQNLSKSTDN